MPVMSTKHQLVHNYYHSKLYKFSSSNDSTSDKISYSDSIRLKTSNNKLFLNNVR